MPFTFVAQQAPALVLSRRSARRWDGVALVVGTMAPDLAYISRGWGYGPVGIPLWFDGHRLQNVLVLTVGALAVSWLVRHVVLPVASLAAPDCGPLHLRDYRYLARNRHRWYVSFASALVGELMHLALGFPFHPDEPVVQHIAPLRANVATVGGHAIRVYALLDVASTILLSALAIRWLLDTGRARAFAPPDAPPTTGLSALGRWTFWTITIAGLVAALLFASDRTDVHGSFVAADTASAAIDFGWVAFSGLVVASLAAATVERRQRPRLRIPS